MVVEDKEALVALYESDGALDTPMHHQHLGSTFAPVKVETDLTKEPGSSEAGAALILKLLEAVEEKW